MTGIPPVEVRSIRPCMDLEGSDNCIFFEFNDYSKECYPDGEYRRERPCPRHFKIGEIWKMIDQHNAGELPTSEDLISFSKWAETLQPNAVEIMRREGFKFDNLEDRWQKLAFSFYSDLSEINNRVRNLFEEDEEQQQPRQEEQYFEEPEACDMCLKNYGSDACRKATCRFKPRQEG